MSEIPGLNEVKSTKWDKKYILLSHHPLCTNFQHHVFRVRSLHFCIGCFLGYPAAVIGILSYTGLKSAFGLDYLTLLVIGIGMVSSLSLSLTRLTRKKPVKYLQKILMGFGSALILCTVWFVVNDPWWIQLILTIGIYLLLNLFLSLVHVFTHNKICKNCKIKQSDPNCWKKWV